MKTDKYGQLVFTETDLCDFYLKNPNLHIKNTLVDAAIEFSQALSLEQIPDLKLYKERDMPLSEFDELNQRIWFMPDEYKNMDIAKWVLEQCSGDTELQRAGQELMLFQERDMFILLKYLKYLVDTMRKHNIVWGVGRGSSVASFVLFLIGIHKIHSLYYGLSIDEFLK